MASSDVDQKFLGRLARLTERTNPLLSSGLYQLLGLSVLLARRLVRARKLRKLDTSRDTKSLQLYHHILWLSREGLSILEICVLPSAQDGQHGPELRVLAIKLRASFYHIFCLFHNQPPISNITLPRGASPGGATGASAAGGAAAAAGGSPRSPRGNNGRRQQQQQQAAAAASGQGNVSPGGGGGGGGGGRTRAATLRDTIPSITSEASYLTNPYAHTAPLTSPPPGLSLPPGFSPSAHIPFQYQYPSTASSFILPALNYLPLTTTHFTNASAAAAAALPGSHPLRLSVALEHAAFLWDCLHDHNAARRLARAAIRDVYRAQEDMDDAEFEDAAEMVTVLGRVMKRKSWEGTPRVGPGSAASPASPDPAQPAHAAPAFGLEAEPMSPSAMMAAAAAPRGNPASGGHSNGNGAAVPPSPSAAYGGGGGGGGSASATGRGRSRSGSGSGGGGGVASSSRSQHQHQQQQQQQHHHHHQHNPHRRHHHHSASASATSPAGTAPAPADQPRPSTTPTYSPAAPAALQHQQRTPPTPASPAAPREHRRHQRPQSGSGSGSGSASGGASKDSAP
ncbi:hypothetical protein BDY21DRAFT_360908 [Lineolata rhizophorae]|uniref:14-3-3 domain-containing protein n=1 Tax=Lineolata rhizophorae TaxID=578093 RepID=A0A6A6PA44_9PEZI|nr:hypothetical protein BDY21DRAFT_360908 [Lineolata rhizophorae]